MSRLLTVALLLAVCAGSGCEGGSGATTAPGPVQLTPEQAEAIKKQDEQIQNEEGGPDKVTQPTKKSTKKR